MHKQIWFSFLFKLVLFQGQQIETLKTEINPIRTELIVDYANYIGVLQKRVKK